MLGTIDDIVLYRFSEIRKVYAVSCHTDHQRRILLRMLLCIQEDILVLTVKLNMMDMFITERCSDKVCHLIYALSCKMTYLFIREQFLNLIAACYFCGHKYL